MVFRNPPNQSPDSILLTKRSHTVFSLNLGLSGYNRSGNAGVLGKSRGFVADRLGLHCAGTEGCPVGLGELFALSHQIGELLHFVGQRLSLNDGRSLTCGLLHLVSRGGALVF
jgi:hypothetical protein